MHSRHAVVSACKRNLHRARFIPPCASFPNPRAASLTTASSSASGPALVSAGFSIPDVTKASSGGEDAYFISPCGSYVGLFDGVGGWKSSGVDAGKYARGLAQACLRVVAAHSSGVSATEWVHNGAVSSVLPPLEVLKHAYEDCHKIIGSSTAVVLALDRNSQVLHAANLGDSGFRVFRRTAAGSAPSTAQNEEWHLVGQSREQFHFFNCPVQIGTRSRDRPSDAQLLAIPVERGDVIVTVRTLLHST